MAQQNLKERLVAAANDAFHTHGFHATSVDDIVRAADVPKGSFYNHFPSKDALAVEVVRRYAASSQVGMELLATPRRSPRKRLRAHLEYMVERTVAWGVDRGCMLGNFATEMAGESPAIAAAVREGLAGWSGALVPVLAEIGLGPDVADYIVNGLEGAYARAKVTGDRRPLDQFLTITLSTVLAGK